MLPQGCNTPVAPGIPGVDSAGTTSGNSQTSFLAPSITNVVEASQITVPINGAYSFIGSCDPSGSISTSASEGISVISAICNSSDNLTIATNIAGLSSSSGTNEYINLVSTPPNGASPVQIHRVFFAILQSDPSTPAPTVPLVTGMSLDYGPLATNRTSLSFHVYFNMNVTGVSVNNFSLTTTGVAGASITSISGAGNSYQVVVNSGSGSGTIRLDLSEVSGIQSENSVAMNATYNSGDHYTIDKTGPVVSISTPQDGALISNPFVLTGTCETGGQQIQISGDGRASSDTSCSNGTYAITLEPLVPDGGGCSRTIAVQQRDTLPDSSMGNLGPSVSRTFIQDVVPWAIPHVYGPTNGWVRSLSTVSFNWDTAQNFRSQYSIGSSSGLSDVLPWTLSDNFGQATTAALSNLALQDGHTYYINVRAISGCGTPSVPTSVSFTVDITPPNLAITSPTAGQSITTLVTPVSGTCEAGLTIYGAYSMQLEQPICPSSGMFSLSVPVGSGTISLNQVDPAGNMKQVSVAITPSYSLTTSFSGNISSFGTPSTTLKSLSQDGRYIVFSSRATNLTSPAPSVPSSSNFNANYPSILANSTLSSSPVAFSQIYRKDLQTGNVVPVSILNSSNASTFGDGDSGAPMISSDGRYVVFTSYATNWRTDSSEGCFNFAPSPGVQMKWAYRVYQKDMISGAINLVSTPNITCSQSNFFSANSMSDDAQTVVFDSTYSIILRKMVDSLPTTVFTGTYGVGTPRVSADGNSIVYSYGSTDRQKIYKINSNGGAPVVVSDGVCQSGWSQMAAYSPSISSGGRHLVFRSGCEQNVAPGTIVNNRIFKIDLQTNTSTDVTKLVESSGSLGASFGTSINGDFPQVSDDGRAIVFVGGPFHQLQSGSTYSEWLNQIIWADTLSGSSRILSASSSGSVGNQAANVPGMTSDGKFVTFYSDATNLSSVIGGVFRNLLSLW